MKINIIIKKNKYWFIKYKRSEKNIKKKWLISNILISNCIKYYEQCKSKQIKRLNIINGTNLIKLVMMWHYKKNDFFFGYKKSLNIKLNLVNYKAFSKTFSTYHILEHVVTKKLKTIPKQ